MLEERIKSNAPPRGFRARLEGKRSNGQFGLIAEIKTKPEIYHVFYEKLAAPRVQQFRQLVERAKARGELRPDLDTPFIVSLIFTSLVYSNIFTELIDPYAKSIYEPETAVDALLRGIGTQPL